MHLSTLALFPALAAAIDYQITHWTCTPTLDPGEAFEQDSNRRFGESGCAGYNLEETDDGGLQGKFDGNLEDDGSFSFAQGPDGIYRFLTFSPGAETVRLGTCQPNGHDNDTCQTAAAACSIVVTHDCTYDS